MFPKLLGSFLHHFDKEAQGREEAVRVHLPIDPDQCLVRRQLTHLVQGNRFLGRTVESYGLVLSVQELKPIDVHLGAGSVVGPNSANWVASLEVKLEQLAVAHLFVVELVRRHPVGEHALSVGHQVAVLAQGELRQAHVTGQVLDHVRRGPLEHVC